MRSSTPEFAAVRQFSEDLQSTHGVVVLGTMVMWRRSMLTPRWPQLELCVVVCGSSLQMGSPIPGGVSQIMDVHGYLSEPQCLISVSAAAAQVVSVC